MRNVIDGALVITLLVCIGFHLWGRFPHEIVGTIMLACFIIHNVLNINWYKNIFKGKYTVMRWLFTATLLLVLADALVLMWSSMVISHHVFTFLPPLGPRRLARFLHTFSAYWGLVLMSFHLGLHWIKFTNMLKIREMSQTSRKMLKLFGLIICAYGIFAFIDRGCIDYITMVTPRVSIATGETTLKFYADMLAIMGAGIFLGNGLTGYLIHRNRKSKSV